MPRVHFRAFPQKLVPMRKQGLGNRPCRRNSRLVLIEKRPQLCSPRCANRPSDEVSAGEFHRKDRGRRAPARSPRRPPRRSNRCSMLAKTTVPDRDALFHIVRQEWWSPVTTKGWRKAGQESTALKFNLANGGPRSTGGNYRNVQDVIHLIPVEASPIFFSAYQRAARNRIS